MSRTERKLRQSLAEIEALRAVRPKMEESIAVLTNQNFEMRSALREAEIFLAKLQVAAAKHPQAEPPSKLFSPLEFALMQVRAALGISTRGTIVFKLFAISTDGHTDECSGWFSPECDCGRKLPR